MDKILKKYTILVILTFIIISLINKIVTLIWPDFVMVLRNGNITQTYGPSLLEKGIEHLFNIVFFFLLYFEMKKGNIKSVPVLILTLFSNILGVIFFLFITVDHQINKNVDNMSDFSKTIKKYMILLIISSFSEIMWFYIFYWIFVKLNFENHISAMPTFMDYLIRLIVVVLLIFDFKKHQLKNVVMACIAALLYPVFGIVLFSILFLTSKRIKAQA